MGIIDDLREAKAKMPPRPADQPDVVLMSRKTWVALAKEGWETRQAMQPPRDTTLAYMGLPVWTYVDEAGRKKCIMDAEDRGLKIMEVTEEQGEQTDAD